MKRIKKGIRSDIDSIILKPREQMLENAGVSADRKSRRDRVLITRLAPIALAAALLVSIGAMFSLAEESEFLTQVQNIFKPEKEKEESRVIKHQNHCSDGFGVLFNLRYDSSDRSKDKNVYYSSVKDAVADNGKELYYPDLEGFIDDSRASIIYSTRGSGSDSHFVFQIGYYNDAVEMFWIHEGEGLMGAGSDAEIYEFEGNEFYISKFMDDGYLSFGVINGNTYQLHTDSVESAKRVIDSLKIAK